MTSGPEQRRLTILHRVKDSNFLDGKHTVFGEVTCGMNVVGRIVELPKNRNLPYLP